MSQPPVDASTSPALAQSFAPVALCPECPIGSLVLPYPEAPKGASARHSEPPVSLINKNTITCQDLFFWTFLFGYSLLKLPKNLRQIVENAPAAAENSLVAVN
jgi:hypothetical protein